MDGLKLRLDGANETGECSILGSFEKAGEDDASSRKTYNVKLSGENESFEAESFIPLLRESVGAAPFIGGTKFAKHLVINRAVDVSSYGSTEEHRTIPFEKAPYKQIEKFGRPLVAFGSGTLFTVAFTFLDARAPSDFERRRSRHANQ